MGGTHLGERDIETSISIILYFVNYQISKEMGGLDLFLAHPTLSEPIENKIYNGINKIYEHHHIISLT